MFRKRHPPVGARPGTLVLSPELPPPRIHAFCYDKDTVEEHDVPDAEALRKVLARDKVTWIDVQGLGNESLLRAIAEMFSLHPLAIEDVANVPQRPKTETYDKHQYFITRFVQRTSDDELLGEQVSIFIGEDYVLTFQERYGDVFDPVRDRLRRGGGPMRRSGPDYLGYAIIDAAIDSFYPVLEAYGEELEELEDEALVTTSNRTLQHIQHIRRDLLTLRRAVWPQREAINNLLRNPPPMFGESVGVYLRDCLDHCVQLIDVLDSYRELGASLMELYMSNVSNRMNEIMKVLTVGASIFIPLTFLAGIYGMNFKHMPELDSAWGYPVLLGVMVVVAVALLLVFRRKGWIGRERDDDSDHG